jgi:hypothetical protein
MNRAFLFALVVVACFAGAVRADDSAATKDNPNYLVWSKFKPGSTTTVVADITEGKDNVHIETTRTLLSVSADNVVIETTSIRKTKGHEITQAPVKQTIPAKTDKDEIKETGTKDMDAMGKTFKCRVWDSAPAKAAKPAESSKVSASEGMKATIYISDEVPGGIVRLDGIAQNGSSVTFILTKFEAK